MGQRRQRKGGDRDVGRLAGAPAPRQGTHFSVPRVIERLRLRILAFRVYSTNDDCTGVPARSIKVRARQVGARQQLR